MRLLKDIFKIWLIKGMMFVVPAGGTGFFQAGQLHQSPSEILEGKPVNASGYNDIIFDGSKFFAVGSGGRIDAIEPAGKKTSLPVAGSADLNCIASGDQTLIAAGNNGTILIRPGEGQFSRVTAGTNKNINCITFFRDLWIAGADDGLLLVSKNGQTWTLNQPGFKGNILSLDCNNSLCFGVTDRGEIIKSSDGLNWQVKDYNKDYQGYNKPCIFRKIIAVQNKIMIIGVHDDSTPAVLYSSLGNVWTERSLSYKDNNGSMNELTDAPNDIAYNPESDEFFVACDNGIIFILPSCSHCNMLYKVAESNIRGIARGNDRLMLAGEKFYSGFFK